MWLFLFKYVFVGGLIYFSKFLNSTAYRTPRNPTNMAYLTARVFGDGAGCYGIGCCGVDYCDVGRCYLSRCGIDCCGVEVLWVGSFF